MYIYTSSLNLLVYASALPIWLYIHHNIIVNGIASIIIILSQTSTFQGNMYLCLLYITHMTLKFDFSSLTVSYKHFPVCSNH